jgi:hypothetical protein
MHRFLADAFRGGKGTAMAEGSNESRYARLNRLRMTVEDKAISVNEHRVTGETLSKKIERLRMLRLAKETIDRRAKKRSS